MGICCGETDKVHSAKLEPKPVTTIDDNDNIEWTTELGGKRKCRDILCLMLFMVFAVITIFVVFYAGGKGDYRRIAGTDSDGCNICGIQNPSISGILNSGQDKRNFRHMFYAKDDDRYKNSLSYLETDRLYYKVCLSTCPSEYKQLSGKCYPKLKNLTTAADFFSRMGAMNFYAEFTHDLQQTYPEILWMCLAGLVAAILMTLLLRFFAGMIVWVVIVGTTVAAIVGSISLWIYYGAMRRGINNNSTDWDQSKLQSLLAFAIIATIFTLLILIIVIGMRKKVGLVIALFKEAGKAVHAIPIILFQPLWTFLFLGVASIGWFFVLVLIETGGNAERYDTDVNKHRCRIVKDKYLLVARWWNIFAILWMIQFIVACQHVIVAGSISKWFFTRNKNELGWPILKSFAELVRYHLGSVAFGSLTIAIVKFIRVILKTVEKQFVNENSVCKVVACCCHCLTWCLENFLIFLNRNAYIEIAIYGYGFCKSARQAFKILVSNALKVAAISSIGDYVLFLAKAVIVIVTVLIGYQLVKDREEVNYTWIPLVIGALSAYFIAHCFIGIYEMAIDTIFLCFCEDCARNDGIKRPYYMSKGLMEFVNNSQKGAKENKEKEKRVSSKKSKN